MKKSVKKPTTKSANRSAKKAASGSVRLPKAEGAAPVRAYFAQVKPEHRAIGEAIDAMVVKLVPEARRAVKWSSPMWGVAGRGWFMAFGSFKRYAKVNFFRGTALKPVPPEGEGKEMRSVNIPTLGELDKKQMAAWIRQAAAIPGWGK